MKVIVKEPVEIGGVPLSPEQQLIVADDVGQPLVDNQVLEKLPDGEPGGFVVLSRDRKAD